MNPGKLSFRLESQDGGARAGILTTRRGPVETPTFMPVATHAHVRNHDSDELLASGAGIALANTYHLMLRPGEDVVQSFGGLHRFMRWPRGILTDSGGYQIFSLSGEREISEQGARFRSPFDNRRIMLSPERSIGVQQALDSDIMMVLDVCIPSTSPELLTREAMERTNRWGLRSLQCHQETSAKGQALFAIVQGGLFENLRSESAAFLTAHPFDGFAVGGLAVGEPREELYRFAALTAAKIPVQAPRYLMGVGTPIDLVECVAAGFDMFDCILPAKMSQQKYAYTFEGQIRLTKQIYRLSDEPLDGSCGCPTCARWSRGYLRHLAQGNHHLSDRLLGIHNLWHFAALMRRMRAAILAGRWSEEYRALRRQLSPPSKLPRPTGVHQERLELVELANGESAIRNTLHNEVMHPTGPWSEANKLYVAQLELEARLRKISQDPLRILDLGLGAGTNALAAIQCARRLAAHRPLEVVSLENDLSAFDLALRERSAFPWMDASAAQTLRRDSFWTSGAIDWRLILGDAEQTVSEIGEPVDLIFFDPYSSEANPSLWTVDFFRALRATARFDGALLATYSSATPTRVALLLAGFFVGVGVAIGTRTETTIASTRPGILAAPLGARWLERWRRSTRRGGEVGTSREFLEAQLLAHPQFAD